MMMRRRKKKEEENNHDDGDENDNDDQEEEEDEGEDKHDNNDKNEEEEEDNYDDNDESDDDDDDDQFHVTNFPPVARNDPPRSCRLLRAADWLARVMIEFNKDFFFWRAREVISIYIMTCSLVRLIGVKREVE